MKPAEESRYLGLVALNLRQSHAFQSVFVERRLEHLREMAAEENESPLDVDEEEEMLEERLQSGRTDRQTDGRADRRTGDSIGLYSYWICQMAAIHVY